MRRSGCLSAELVVKFCLGLSGVQPHRPSLSFVSFVVWCEESSHMWSKFAPIVSSPSSSSAPDIGTGQLASCVCTSTRVQVGVQSKHTISSYHRVGEFKFTAAINQAVFVAEFVQSVPAVSAYLNARDQELSSGVSFIKIGASGRNRQVLSCCALSSFKYQSSV